MDSFNNKDEQTFSVPCTTPARWRNIREKMAKCIDSFFFLAMELLTLGLFKDFLFIERPKFALHLMRFYEMRYFHAWFRTQRNGSVFIMLTYLFIHILNEPLWMSLPILSLSLSFEQCSLCSVLLMMMVLLLVFFHVIDF